MELALYLFRFGNINDPFTSGTLNNHDIHQ